MKIRRIISFSLAMLMLATMVPLMAMPAKAATNVELRLWVEEVYPEWAAARIDAFKKLHPEWNLKVSIEGVGVSDVGSIITADPQIAADVFMYPNDQVGNLVEANMLLPLSGDAYNQAIREYANTVLNTVKYNGKIYGLPYATNTWYMYYNKSVFSESDIKSLDTMLSKGRVSFPLTNPWYLASFYYANGGSMFGESSTDAIYGMNFGDDNAIAVTNYLVDLVNHPNFVDDTMGDSSILKNDADVFFSGVWNSYAVKSILGENYAAAQLPTVRIAGKNCQMKAFSGTKAIGINANTKHPEVAQALATFLANEEAQLELYLNFNSVPACDSLSDNPYIAADPAVRAQIRTMNNTSVIQPYLPEMAHYWGVAGTLGNYLANGMIDHDNAADYTLEFALNLNQGVAITAHPDSVSADAGENVVFAMKAIGDIYSYQWQCKASGGTWRNCTETGADTSILTVPVTSSMNGNVYRCVVTTSMGHELSTAPAQLKINGLEGWVKEDGQWCYYQNGEKLINEWLKSGSKWYYLDAEGVMATGWAKIDGKWYYFSSNGAMQTGWQKVSGKWYYLKSDMKTGWQQVSGKWYYMDASGAMQTGWEKVGGKWYYMNANGVMQTGWQKIDGKWYYLKSEMKTGWQKIGNNWYYLGTNGAMQTGWVKLSGKWYYLNDSGAMVTGTQTIDGKTYKFNSSGVWIS